MTVRPATDRDLEAIRPLLEQLMQPDVPVDHACWDAALRHEGYRAWVAEVDGKVAGFVDLFVLPDVGHGRRIGVINTLVTNHRHRRRGIGARLVREAIDECRRRDAVEVHVWTGFDNAPAIGLYRKLGFADRALLLELALDEPS